MAKIVTIPKHLYSRDSQSGAGNCWCGRHQKSRLHPHEFTPASKDPLRCVCRGFANDQMHCTDLEWIRKAGL